MTLFKLPYEIIEYHIIFHLSYLDILNWCKAYPKFKYIYEDNIFWKCKLDNKYTIIGINGLKCIPTYYIKYHTKELLCETYKRWEIHQDINLSSITLDLLYYDIQFLDSHIDIIIFALDKIKYDIDVITTIFNCAQEFNKLCIMMHIYKLYPNYININHLIKY